MKLAIVPLLVSAVVMAGCSGGGFSVGSILGGDSAPKPVASAPVPPASDSASRAFQVGAVSARAMKCGYNFDPVKLKASYMASEAARGASLDEVGKAEKIYDIAFNGITKAASAEPDYCSEQKTKEIKTDLTRHLAGDYEPAPRKVAVQEEGLFSGLFGGDSSSSSDGLNIKPSTANGY